MVFSSKKVLTGVSLKMFWDEKEIISLNKVREIG